jgi:hypothetical protein
MGLKLDFHDVTDLPEMEKLWQEETDWGDDTLSALHKWFMAAPHGNPSIVVATNEDTGNMVGQFRFMPTRVWVDGREVNAVRPFGTIVTQEAHEASDVRSTLDNPIAKMYLFGVREFRKRGVSIVHMVPDQRWLGLLKRWAKTLKLFKINYGTFPFWSLSLPLAEPKSLGPGFRSEPLEQWDDRVDKLWKASRNLHGCQLLRDIRNLQWKLAQADHTVTAVYRDDELVGLVASRHKGDRQWLVCDVLAANDDALRATLAAVVNVGNDASLNRNGSEEIRKIGLLVTPKMESIVSQLGFVRDDYEFPLFVHVIGKSVKAKQVAPSRWYVSAND